MSNISADISIVIIKAFSEISREIVTNCYPIIGDFIHHLLVALGGLYLVWTAIRYYLMVGGEPDLRVMFTTIFKIMICISIASNHDSFYNYFYSPLMDFFEALPVIVVKASMGSKNANYDTVLHMLSESVSHFKELSFKGVDISIWDWAGSSALNVIFSVILGIVFFTLLCAFTIINVFAIVSANLILMLAPIIIGLAAFEPTKKYASNMVNSFVCYAIRPTFSAVAIAVVVFVLSKFQVTSGSFVDNLGEWLTVIIIGIVGIVLQLRTEEYASAITTGAIGSGSGIAAMVGGAVAGGVIASKAYGAGKNIAGGTVSAGKFLGNQASKALDSVRSRYMPA